MTRVALITTTINVPTVLEQWVNSGMTEDDVIIVAGDQKSPHSDIEDLLNDITMRHGVFTEYMAPDDQKRFTISDAIGWNCIQRRNIALLRAMELKPAFILTIDDDNAPTSSRQVEQLIEIMNGETKHTPGHTPTISTNTGWYNPGRHCLTDQLRPVTHRGFPLSQRFVNPLITYEHHATRAGVAAMLWTGEPDIDTVERIAVRPNVARLTRPSVVLDRGTWAPFNTQATMIRGDLAPALFMWPHVGRYDDIWASYVYRKVADKRGYGAYYGHPAVHQDRNEHDLVKDLEDEIFGMRHNESIIRLIQDVDLDSNSDVLTDVAKIFSDVIVFAHPLSRETKRALAAWVASVEEING